MDYNGTKESTPALPLMGVLASQTPEILAMTPKIEDLASKDV
jgi:hypothetical protein